MQRTLTSILSLAVCLLFTQAAQAADVAGTWKWSVTGQGGQARETTLKLKMDGDQLKGTVSGRNADTEIEEAKIKGDEVTFKVTREFGGNKMTQKYTGKLSGDTIKGKVEGKNRDGEDYSRDWEAKRSKE